MHLIIVSLYVHWTTWLVVWQQLQKNITFFFAIMSDNMEPYFCCGYSVCATVSFCVISSVLFVVSFVNTGTIIFLSRLITAMIWILTLWDPIIIAPCHLLCSPSVFLCYALRIRSFTQCEIDVNFPPVTCSLALKSRDRWRRRSQSCQHCPLPCIVETENR